MRYRANLIGVASACAGAAVAVAWGWIDAGGLRADAPGHATAVIGGAIGLLLALPILASTMAVNARVRAVRAAPAGRWTVTPAQTAALLEWQRGQGLGNEWRPGPFERRRSFEVCWAGEHLVVGPHYWRVAPGQIPRFDAVRARLAAPGSVELHYMQPWMHNMSSVTRIVPTQREFRFPAPDELQARSLVKHFNRVLTGESTLGRRRRLRRLSNWAFGAGACCLAMLLSGVAVGLHDRSKGIYRPDTERAALIFVTVLGVMGTPVLLLLGWEARRRER